MVDRNPFAPAGQAAGPAQPAEQPTLEFRGMVTDFEGTVYNIFDTSTSKGSWVRVDDPESPFKVRGFDPSSSTIEVEQNGRPLKLTLKRATIQAGPAMVPGAPAPGATSGEARRNGDSGTDARRLEAVAAEVRRRRALRSAAGTAQGQPPAAAKPAPPAGP